MIVLDASATIEWLLQTSTGLQIDQRVYSRRETLHSPHLLDVEVAHVLRRLVASSRISAIRGEQALRDLIALRITRYPHDVFLARIWQLRHNLSSYDASYVCLAEDLGASLLTCDARLSTVPGHQARVEVF